MDNTKLMVLEEIKAVVKEFPKSGGVGTVVGPVLCKLAADLGLVGYSKAIQKWHDNSTLGFSCTVDVEAPKEEVKKVLLVKGLAFNWDGPALSYAGRGIVIGIKETLRQIELRIGEKSE